MPPHRDVMMHVWATCCHGDVALDICNFSIISWYSTGSHRAKLMDGTFAGPEMKDVAISNLVSASECFHQIRSPRSGQLCNVWSHVRFMFQMGSYDQIECMILYGCTKEGPVSSEMWYKQGLAEEPCTKKIQHHGVGQTQKHRCCLWVAGIQRF